MYQVAVEFARQSWLVLGQTAPYSLLGFLVAGLGYSVDAPRS